MTKYLIFLLFSLFITPSYSFGPVEIYANGEYQALNLKGSDGLRGRDGKHAYPLDCEDGLYRVGRNGEAGGDGEAGEPGRSVFVHYEKLADLKLIQLDQRGGEGGEPGLPGNGSTGCNGGPAGQLGPLGSKGDNGQFGRVFLIPNNSLLTKDNTGEVLNLGELHFETLYLTRHSWLEQDGTKELFHPKSYVYPKYFVYDDTIEYSINLKWSAYSDIDRFYKTKMALSIRDGDLELTVYSGAVLDYNIHRKGNHFTIEVLRAYDEDEFKNLSLGKMRGSGEDLLLEVKEKHRPGVSVHTRFIITLYDRKLTPSGVQESVIGSFPIAEDQVLFQERKFYLMIGNLNFPAKYKKQGTKLRVHLNVYREAHRQTRVLGIKGLFKI